MSRARGQDGLTLIETLVMIAVTALVGAALVNVATRANAANSARATRALDAEAIRRVEADLRRAGAAAEPGVVERFSISGGPRSVRWATIGYAPCGNGSAVTTFSIEASAQGGRLVRTCAGRTELLAQWPASVRADFAFSADGYSWRALPPALEPRDPGADQGIYLRWRVRGPGAEERVSVMRLGGAPGEKTSLLEYLDRP